MTQNELLHSVNGHLKRDFNVQETLLLLKMSKGVMTFLSWGVSKLMNVDDKGLLMKVSGNHHKGWVLVTLNWLDYYDVHIISNKGEVKDVFTDIFFTDLCEIIDNRIEKIPSYHR